MVRERYRSLGKAGFTASWWGKALVPEEKAKCFVRWGERFLQTATVAAPALAPEAISAFLADLSRQEEPGSKRGHH